MTDFNWPSCSNGRSTKSPNPSYANSRRSSGDVMMDPEVNPRFKHPSPQAIRRLSSNAQVGTSMFRTRSPSDPQNYVEDVPHLSRRYSQPSSSPSHHRSGGNYVDHPSPSLVRQERRTYSSLNHLPEVRTYLQFMEDSTVLPQRSKSFNGRNSSRRSSFNRRRPRSRPRTPLGDDQDPVSLHRVGSGSSSHYGNYLTPRTASLEQSNPRRHFDYDQGNEADVEDIDGEPMSKLQQSSCTTGPLLIDRMSAATSGLYHDSLSRRRSSIRTTFI